VSSRKKKVNKQKISIPGLKKKRPKKYASLEMMSDVLLLSNQWINRLVKKGILKRAGRGQYDLKQCVNDYIRYLKKQIDGVKGGGDAGRDAKNKEAYFAAEITEMEYYKKAKELVAIEDVIRSITGPWKATQTKMRSLPRQLAPQLVGLSVVEIEEHLENKINDCLTESANIPYTSGRSIGPKQRNRKRMASASSAAGSND